MAELGRSEFGSQAWADIENKIDRYHDELRPVGEAIVATRAVTLDGLLVKARAVQWAYRDDPEQLMAQANGTDDELSRSITADL